MERILALAWLSNLWTAWWFMNVSTLVGFFFFDWTEMKVLAGLCMCGLFMYLSWPQHFTNVVSICRHRHPTGSRPEQKTKPANNGEHRGQRRIKTEKIVEHMCLESQWITSYNGATTRRSYCTNYLQQRRQAPTVTGFMFCTCKLGKPCANVNSSSDSRQLNLWVDWSPFCWLAMHSLQSLHPFWIQKWKLLVLNCAWQPSFLFCFWFFVSFNFIFNTPTSSFLSIH